MIYQSWLCLYLLYVWWSDDQVMASKVNKARGEEARFVCCNSHSSSGKIFGPLSADNSQSIYNIYVLK